MEDQPEVMELKKKKESETLYGNNLECLPFMPIIPNPHDLSIIFIVGIVQR